MERSYVSAIDGIPGIMPGTKSLLPPPPFKPEEKQKILGDRQYGEKCVELLKQKSCIIKQPKKSE